MNSKTVDIRKKQWKDIADQRRVSNIDALKSRIALRFDTLKINPNKKKNMDDSDDN